MSKQYTKAFEEAYARLNTSQRQAVDTIDGPVMVIAGPGTGKTQILTLRIANILIRTDTPPESVLALTFTNAGAHAMRARLRSFIGQTAQRIPIYTFHSFSEHLIKQFPEAYPTIIGGEAVTDVQVFTLVETLLSDPLFTALRPVGKPDYYVRDCIGAISNLKREGFSPDGFASFVLKQEQELATVQRIHEKGAHKGKVRGEYIEAEKKLLRNQELLQLYRRYDAALRADHLYDYDDMILETVRALSQNEEMRLVVQETYQYVLADEHQDVNGSQNRILEVLVDYHRNPNIFVVGDEKQAIYRFQGASLENFLRFQTLYPNAVVIPLVDNYRSSQDILDAAERLVVTEDPELAALRVALKATTNDTATLSCQTFNHQAFEDEWVVATVKGQLAAGIPASEIALIVRKNRQVEHYTSLLRSQGIPVAPSADSDMLQHPLTKSVLLLLEAVAKPDDEVVFSKLLHEPYWQFAPGDLVRLFAARSLTRPLSAIVATPEDEVLGLEAPLAISRVHNVLKAARERALTEAPQQVLAYVLEESGLLRMVLARDPLESGRIIRRVYDEVEAAVSSDHSLTLTGVVKLFSQRLAYGLSLTAPLVSDDEESVVVTTAHKSKGLEFNSVIIPDASTAVWDEGARSGPFVLPIGVGQKLPDSVQLEDNVRLFYVAVTRAKRALFLSCAAVGSDGRSRSLSVLAEMLGLVSESVSSVVSDVKTSELTGMVVQNKPVAVTEATIRAALERYGLSATSLNNYLKSPWNYLYRNVLRIPEPKSFVMQYGTVLHAVIDAFVHERASTGHLLNMTEVATRLRRAIESLPVSVEEFTRMHERGLSALAAYLPQLPVAVRQQTEVSLSAVLPTGLKDFPEVTLTGKLDRLDFDASGRLVCVTDYKTGKARTRGQIEGTTKDSEGEYKRQLVFYALLLSLQDNPDMRCRHMCLSFVEPTPKGEIKQEEFIITDDEVAALRVDIIRVVEEIVSGKCLQVVCDPDRCDYCDLAVKLQVAM